MKLDAQLDHAVHELKVNALLKEIHHYLLKSNFKSAASAIDHAIVELRLMRAVVKSQLKE